ncbi:hypothetical protein D6D01_06345 [Aureobasidium pullulans]|uniref:MFS general substrate transporter n=1 Tax=Aureobasidium pullulans TaxID=5580 RepID=A0A4S9L053_AURPU|nr:hypothetical protein D6D01_06345 [Aureobasidium pullulans]
MARQDDLEKDVESSNLEKTLTFDADPSLNPRNFPLARKILILSVAVLLTTSSTCGTSLASGGAKATLRDFSLPEAYGWEVLPVSIYLGLVYRQHCTGTIERELWQKTGQSLDDNILHYLDDGLCTCTELGGLQCLQIVQWVLLCRRAGHSYFIELATVEIVLRPTSLSRICADLYSDDMRRGRALLWYNMATTLGSTFGPLISGFAVFGNWRLSYWIGIGYGGICFLGVLFLIPETNSRTILDKRAKKNRKTEGTDLRRQILGAALPFAAIPMYDALGVGWASSLLGFVAAIMSLIPFMFWMYGEKLLEKSSLVQELARIKEQESK